MRLFGEHLNSNMKAQHPALMFKDRWSHTECWLHTLAILAGMAAIRAWLLPDNWAFPFLPFAIAVPAIFFLYGRWPGAFYLLASGAVGLIQNPDAATRPLLAAQGFIFYAIQAGIIGWLMDLLQSTALAFRESERIQKDIMENQLDWVSRVDAAGRFTFINPAAARAYGLSETRDLGSDWRPIVFRDDFPAVRAKLESLSPTHPVVELECRIRPVEGIVRWGHFKARGIFDSDGQMTAFQSVGRDITDKKRAEAQLEELTRTLERRVEVRTEALQRKSEELEAFTYSLSHDLRAPLRTINAAASILLEEQQDMPPEEAKSWLVRIRDSSEQSARLMDALLALSAVERNAGESVPFSNRDLVRSTLDGLLPADSPRRKQVVVGELPDAIGEPNLVRQVWENLLANALKFTAREESPRIEVGFDAIDQAYFVRDNGVGFDMDHAKKLFQPFERVHENRQFPGMGIGLSIAERVIRRHGGRIWCKASPGNGALFRFTLPLAAEKAP